MASRAVAAFDASAECYDERFGFWASVRAQRRAVRRRLLRAFAPASRVLELGGGTGEDAIFLAEAGRHVLLTDGSARMMRAADAKVRAAGCADRIETAVLSLERIEAFAREWRGGGRVHFDGAYSNFAALNCVPDLRPVARGLADLLLPGARAMLVLFGPTSPGEAVVQLVRGEARAAFRRRSRGPVPARLGGVEFEVWYPRPNEVARAFEPWFRPVRTRGIGVFVPPSAAEPWISGHPRLLAVLEGLDRVASGPLARFGDHVLVELERTRVAAPHDAARAGRYHPRRPATPSRRFREAYAEQREAEGRGRGGADELLALPYLRTGPHRSQWAVRARSYERFVTDVLGPLARQIAPRPLRLLDLGAGNGWLAARVRAMGHEAVAIDMRDDRVDGLGALSACLGRLPVLPIRLAGSFEALPLGDGVADVAVFNAAVHYALDLGRALSEARRVVRPGGRIVILDSPFYESERDGEAMVAEKLVCADARFGERAAELTAPGFVEYLTPERLRGASRPLGLEWRRHRVRYPIGYELRPLLARLRRRRTPSRFDVWEGTVQ